MSGASARQNMAEAMATLRVSSSFNETDLRRAKRALLFESHPDHAGRTESDTKTSIDEVLASYDFLMSVLADKSNSQLLKDLITSSSSEHQYARDLPSFTVNALPVDAYHLLFVAAHELGEVVEEEEPYFMVVRMSHPTEYWCEIDVVPDAGASTVSLSATRCDNATGALVDIIAVRDLWVHTINGLQTPS